MPDGEEGRKRGRKGRSPGGRKAGLSQAKPEPIKVLGLDRKERAGERGVSEVSKK